MAVPNIGKFQRTNSVKITSFIDSMSVNSAAERGDDLDFDSPIEQILQEWAVKVVVDIKKSLADKKFNTKGNLSQSVDTTIVDEAGVIKALQVTMDESWYWAEHGRGKSKKKGDVPLWKFLEQWITYRGIDVHSVNSWAVKEKNKEGKIRTLHPYKNITDTLKLRHIMAQAFASSIHKKGTIKRFGYNGSKFLSSVINDKALNDLSLQVSEAVGFTVAISLANQI